MDSQNSILDTPALSSDADAILASCFDSEAPCFDSRASGNADSRTTLVHGEASILEYVPETIDSEQNSFSDRPEGAAPKKKKKKKSKLAAETERIPAAPSQDADQHRGSGRHASAPRSISDEEVDVEVVPSITFSDLGLPPSLCNALASSGYLQPTPIQAATIPALLEGRDVLGQANTGTGKTAAFALPLLSGINVDNPNTQVLVLAPTRELAIQVAESFAKYGEPMRGLNVAAVYGGSGYSDQIQALRRGAHVVVGTPGRVMDHMREGRLRLDELRCFVLDEADEMLRMGFVDDVQWVLEQAPAHVQFALFSATMPNAIRQIADKHLKDPHVVSLIQQQRTASTIRQRCITIEPRTKAMTLQRVLELEETDGVIVFVKTRAATVELAEFLMKHGISAVAINGDIPQAQRERSIEQLKQGTFDVLVATDVAARGLDVQRITHVINYDLPFDSEAYVHRIGRTGRAGRTGEAILFVTMRQRGFIRELERTVGCRLESMEIPTLRDINRVRKERFVAAVQKSIESNATSPNAQFQLLESIVTECMTQSQATPTQVAASIASMLFENRPLLLEERDDFVRGDRRPPRDRFAGRESSDGRFEGERRFEGDRGERGERGRPPRRSDRAFDEGQDRGGSFQERFRVEVGRVHGVRPGNLVGAIANEIGLDSSSIGQITIYDEFSTVFLPSGMPREVFKTLGRAWVVGRQLRISKWKDHPSVAGKAPRERFRRGD